MPPPPGNYPPPPSGPGYGSFKSPDSASRRSIVALVLAVLGIVCCGFFSGIPAVVLGMLEIRDGARGKSKTLSQLAIGLGVVAIIWGVIQMIWDPLDLR